MVEKWKPFHESIYSENSFKFSQIALKYVATPTHIQNEF